MPSIALMLARNLADAILTPALLVDDAGAIIFYNEAAAELIGRRFEEGGRLSATEWGRIGPVDEIGRPLPADASALTGALEQGLPVYGRFRILTDQGSTLPVTVTALPLVSEEEFCGALITFVAAEDVSATAEAQR
ncbi:MAG TPA: PAS domain-containing protein [Solirubrobacteraceae bacterium]|jgi:PAS domain-containing protein|nr:PAS domain-containing protein [Solirubrobacteraceae bacterium]